MASNVLFLLLFQVTVYVTDIDAISDVKKICAKYFVEPFPARWSICCFSLILIDSFGDIFCVIFQSADMKVMFK